MDQGTAWNIEKSETQMSEKKSYFLLKVKWVGIYILGTSREGGGGGNFKEFLHLPMVEIMCKLKHIACQEHP